MLGPFASATMLELGNEWTGAIWRQNRTGLGFQFARELARDLSIREPDRVRYVSSKTSFAAGVERFARSDPAFAVTSEQWDSDPMLLGTPNGTVNLRTGAVAPAKSEWGITKSTLCSPAADANCLRWIAFLSEATGGDRDLIRFLQQWSGYGLTGSTKEHALVFLHGGGGEGKSTFINTVSRILATMPSRRRWVLSSRQRQTTIRQNLLCCAELASSQHPRRKRTAHGQKPRSKA